MNIQKELDPTKILLCEFEGKIYLEQWYDIPEYENMYEISTFGRTKRLAKELWNGKGYHNVKEIILKPHIDVGGYLRVNLSKNGESKYIKIHRTMALIFYDYIYDKEKKMVCDHKDDDKLNNFYKNHQIISYRENCSKEAKRNRIISNYTGVSKSRKKWKARIRINGKQVHIGVFENEFDAHLAYQNKLKEL